MLAWNAKAGSRVSRELLLAGPGETVQIAPRRDKQGEIRARTPRDTGPRMPAIGGEGSQLPNSTGREGRFTAPSSNLPLQQPKADSPRSTVNEPGPRGSQLNCRPPRGPGSATIDVHVRPSLLNG